MQYTDEKRIMLQTLTGLIPPSEELSILGVALMRLKISPADNLAFVKSGR